METKEKQPLFSLSICRTLLLLAHYFICYGFLYRYIATYMTLQINPHATIILPGLQWTIYILTALITILLAWPALKNAYYRFKANLSKNIALIALMGVVLIATNLILSFIVAFFTKSNGSNNQALIRQAQSIVPFITIMASCFFAPLIEECVFRCGAFAFLRKKAKYVGAAIISSLLFASIHFFASLQSGNLMDLSYLIVYFGLGIILSYSYEKSDSVIVSFAVHFLNNALATLAMFL